MSLFRKQPLFCANCGQAMDGDPDRPWCDQECWQVLEWKKTLYILGKEFYPQP